MKRTNSIFWTLIVLISLVSCRKELKQKEILDMTDPNVDLLEINIPDNFKFQTSEDVTLAFNGFKSSTDVLTKYNVYLYNPQGKTVSTSSIGDDGITVDQTGVFVDAMSDFVFTSISSSSTFDLKLTIPSYYDSIYIVKNEMANYSSLTLPINSNKIAVNFDSEVVDIDNFKATGVDLLYGVNSNSELFTINTETGELQVISSLPNGSGGSMSCAMDPIKEIVYAIGINSPYKLYEYNINSDQWKTKGKVNFSGSRLGYNIADGLLYYSFDDKIVKLDTKRGKMLSYYDVIGLQETKGGDITFSRDGEMYISTSSGLYTCEYTNDNKILATRISSDGLPNDPTSLTFGSDDKLWWASNDLSHGITFVMDYATGGWVNKFNPFDHTIYDLALLPLDMSLIKQDDSDGDGTIDFYDEYPNNGNLAYTIYTPSIYGQGSYAFEDLWPSIGDFDFNDMVVNYRYSHSMNSAGLVAETNYNFTIANVGGSFKNGFGIQIDTDESLINQVTGYSLTEGLISINSKGLENNQSKPVIIVFDNAWQNVNYNGGNINIKVTYNTPIPTSQVGDINPFIFIDGVRSKEVHLVDMEPTDLMDLALFGTADDDSDPSIGRYYRNATNLPWAIDILYSFTFPKEKKAINKGYTKFATWASSGGSEFKDWYKDQADYRNTEFLDLNK